MIKISDLSVHFGKKEILTKINIDIPDNSVVGVLGKNGCGKTTLLLAILHLIKYSGSIVFDKNKSYNQYRTKIGAIFDEPGFYNYSSVKKNVLLFTKNQPIEDDLNIALMDFKISQYKDTLWKKLSYGNKRKLQWVVLLFNKPDLILIDEGFNGFDYITNQAIKSKIIQLKEAGKTLLISSHHFNDLNDVCTHILYLNKGCVEFFGKIESFDRKIMS